MAGRTHFQDPSIALCAKTAACGSPETSGAVDRTLD